MPRTPTIVPGLRKVELPEARQAIPALHAYLRECVLDGTLTPGTKLSQVALADQLGVSRTPLREVLRMLQEEGLVEIEPNQRTRVAGLDPQELDDVYASRILLETLALSMTLDSFTGAYQREARRMLTAMRQAAKSGDFGTWFDSHGEFHRLITAGCRDRAAASAHGICRPDDPLYPHLPAVRAGELAGRRRRRACGHPDGTERGRPPGGALRPGAPSGQDRRARAHRLRARLQDQRRHARAGAGRADPADRPRLSPMPEPAASDRPAGDRAAGTRPRGAGPRAAGPQGAGPRAAGMRGIGSPGTRSARR